MKNINTVLMLLERTVQNGHIPELLIRQLPKVVEHIRAQEEENAKLAKKVELLGSKCVELSKLANKAYWDGYEDGENDVIELLPESVKTEVESIISCRRDFRARAKAER